MAFPASPGKAFAFGVGPVPYVSIGKVIGMESVASKSCIQPPDKGCTFYQPQLRSEQQVVRVESGGPEFNAQGQVVGVITGIPIDQPLSESDTAPISSVVPYLEGAKSK